MQQRTSQYKVMFGGIIGVYIIHTYLLIRPVPPPDVNITLNSTPPLYAGTGLTVTCTVTLDSNVDNGEEVVTEWNGPRNISDDRVTANNLTISPLADLDNGTYTCTVTVTGGSNVQQVTASDNVTITVMGK